MGGRRVGNWLLGILLAANCLVLWAIITMWWGPGEAPGPAKSTKGPEVPVAPMLRNQQPLSEFKVVASKSLFSQDRTGPDLETGRSGQGTLEGRQLLGTMIIGEKRVALIGGTPPARGQKEAPVEVLSLGEQWGGFTIVEISPAGVVFQGRNGKTTLNFPEER